jgi:hypothetical protein
MIDFLGYKKTFREKIQWCDSQLAVVEQLRSRKKEEVLLKLLEYKKDCLICCRKVDLFKKKYPKFNGIPDDLYKETKGYFLAIMFNKHERIMTTIQSLKHL